MADRIWLRAWRALGLLLVLGASTTALAQQTFNKTRISGATAATNGIVTYRLEGSCSSAGPGGCGTLTITDVLPPELIVANCPTSSFFTITCATGDSTFTLVRAAYAGGDTFSVDFNARVIPTITASVINVVNRAVASINGAACPPPPQNATVGVARPPLPPDTATCDYAEPAPVTIPAPTPQYEVRKTRFSPAPPITIAAGQAISYQVQLCSTSATGNMRLPAAILVDTLPNVAGLTAASVELNPDGGIVAAGPPVTITWNLTDTTPPPTGLLGLNAGTGCVSRSFAVRYPAALPNGTAVNNSVNATVLPAVGTPGIVGPAVRNDNIAAPAPAGTSSKSAPDVAPGTGQPIVFSIAADTNSSNARIPNFQVIDRLPPTPLPSGITFSSVSSGTWSNPPDGAVTTDVRATIEYTTLPLVAGVCDFSAVTNLATNIAGTAAQTYNVPVPLAANATCVRWRFTDAGVNGPNMPRNWSFSGAPEVRYAVSAAAPAPSTLQNCTYTDFTGATVPRPQQCANVRVEQPTPSVQPIKTMNPTVQAPGGTIDITLGGDHVAGDSTSPIVNPVLSDWLPIQLEFVSLIGTTPGGAALQVTQNFGSPGRTLVRVSFTGSFPVGSTGPRATIRARVRDGVPANPSPAAAYVNDLGVFINPGPSGEFTCPNNTPPIADANDLDNDGSTVDLVCRASADFRVSEAFVLGGEKWVQGDITLPNVGDPADGSVATNNSACPDYDTTFGGPAGQFTRVPCVAQTTHGGAFTYRLRLANAGNRLLDEYIAYDVLPFVGDRFVGEPLFGTLRDTRWLPALNGSITTQVVVPPVIQLINPGLNPVTYATGAQVRVEYTTTTNFCRGQVRIANFDRASMNTAGVENSFPTGCTPGVWTTTLPIPASSVTGFRVRAFSDATAPASTEEWVPGTYIEVDVPMIAPATGAPPSFVGGTAPNVGANPAIFNPAWNSIAHRVFRSNQPLATDLLPTAEPPKVGIILPERYRLGNLVWLDNGAGNPAQRNNARADIGEPGIDNVSVRLCRDTDGTAGPSGGDTVVGNTTTATLGGQLGKYAFSDLSAANNYYLAIPNVAGQAALTGLFSSTPDEAAPNNDTDNNDNGLGNAGAPALVTVCGGTAGSMVSGTIALGPATGVAPTPPEPTNEELRLGSGTDDDNDGNTVFADSASNFSVDFGFVQPTDLGDLPDTGAGVGAANFETLLASNGPAHPMINAMRLGACVDAENNGQPGAAATGDDTGAGTPTNGTCATANDDEDGVTVSDLTQFVGAPANVRVSYNNPNAGANSARICGFIDYNNDGNFAGAEIVTQNVNSGAGTATLAFGTVPAGSVGTRYARFRISSDIAAACAAVGPSTDGEVEDYVVNVFDAVDFGDLPDTTAGTGVGDYQTLLANGGPSHILNPNLRLGACEDAEVNGQPGATATGDDTGAGTLTNGTCAVANDDEDAVQPAELTKQIGAPATLQVNAVNNIGGAAQLCAFIDWNGNGVFTDTVGGTPETATLSVANGTNGNVTVNFGGPVPLGALIGQTYLRVRVSTDTNPCSANGNLPNGEVEDYRVTITATDLGDLPDTGAGIGTGNYQTLLSDNGAVHTIVPGAFLGASVDPEINGQPNANANGDDNALTPDDEDGVVFPGAIIGSTNQLIAGRANPVTVTASLAGRLNCWFDFNANGNLLDAGENVFADTVVAAGANALSINVPAAAAGVNVYHRCRYTTGAAQATAPTGSAPNGEVEDSVTPSRGTDLGDLPAPYPTLRANSGALHAIVPNMFFGAGVDNELDGQPSAPADGDDLAGTPDDEDGVAATELELVAGLNATIRASATNQSGLGAANACGFLDINGDGDFGDANETQGPVAVPDGAAAQVVSFNFGTLPVTATRQTYARFRLSTAAGCTPTGEVANGEVEDYRADIFRRDLGDLPDTGAGIGTGNYRTLRADNGAAHEIVNGLFMGAGVDQEVNGQPSVNADGDDLGAPTPDDEDGVTLDGTPLGYELGSPARAIVNATNTTAAAVNACGFIDWNGDGDFADANEAAQLTVPAGTNAQNFTLQFGLAPLTAVPSTYGRFRLNSGACASEGLAPDGEVEDYVVTTTTNGALSLGNLVWEDLDNDGTADVGEPGIDGVPVSLFQDDDQNCQPDGAALSTQPTAGGGNYLFTNLLPGFYLVQITPPAEYLGSTGSGRYRPNGPYEPALDPDNNINDDDNGTQAGAVIGSTCAIELRAKLEPVNDGDSDFNSNLTVDFGLVRNFDLAIRKVLAPNQVQPVQLGQLVDFNITVFNQGSVTATQIEVTDYLPAGLVLADAAWTSASGNRATRTIAGPLAPGANTVITLRTRMDQLFSGYYVNTAEISVARDGAGVIRPDKDSTPDNNGGNDGPPQDDAIDNEGDDEDDMDIAGITVAFSIPVDARWAMALMIALLGLSGMWLSRRRA
jgi:uncharacterized repeat protein (TIGR01451 family)